MQSLCSCKKSSTFDFDEIMYILGNTCSRMYVDGIRSFCLVRVDGVERDRVEYSSMY